MPRQNPLVIHLSTTACTEDQSSTRRFSVHKIALSADIEKAFLMVSVSKKDGDVLHFPWIGDVTSDEPPVHVLRFTRVTFSVTSSPFLLNATIEHHLNKFSSSYPELVELLKRSIYVDDVVTGAESEEAAYQAYLDSRSILKAGRFNLRKFISSSSTLQAKIDQDQVGSGSTLNKQGTEETYAKSTLGNTQGLCTGETKILGVVWDVGNDRFVFNISEVASKAREIEPMKRNAVSTVRRFCDPIGFLSPLIVRYKIFFQHLCESQTCKEEFAFRLEGIPTESTVYGLHEFSVASKAAYASVVYLVVEMPVDRVVKFIASKTRVAPLREQTIPRPASFDAFTSQASGQCH